MVWVLVLIASIIILDTLILCMYACILRKEIVLLVIVFDKIFDSSLARYQNSSSELVEVRLG